MFPGQKQLTREAFEPELTQHDMMQLGNDKIHFAIIF